MKVDSSTHPFRASLVREFRQHGVWTGAVAVAMSALFAFLLYTGRTDSFQSIARGLFVTGAMLTFTGIGLTMGLTVMLGELRRGRWGFLVHRPLSRRRLFASKFVAAATMYLAATTLAIGVAAVFANSPRFARVPFTVSMLLPAIYFQICGLAWLACGLLIAVREASWVATRLYPLAITALVLILLYGWKIPFAAAAGTVLLLTGVLVVSGAHFFAANGAYEPQPRRAKPLAFLVVFCGGMVLLTNGVDQVVGGVVDAFGPEAPRLLSSTYYGIDSVGRPYRHDQFNTGTWEERFLDGTPRGHYGDDPKNAPFFNYQGGAVLYAGNPFDTDAARARAARRSFLEPDEFDRGRFDRWSGVSYTSYTFNPHRRTIEEYGPGNEYLGGVGPNGFYGPNSTQDRFPPTTRFHGAPWSRLIMSSNDTVWRIDLRHRTVDRVFQADADGPVLDASECRVSGNAAAVCVLTPRHVYAVPVPHESQEPDWIMPGVPMPGPSMPQSLPPLIPTKGPVRVLELPELKPGARVSVGVFGDDGMAALTDATTGADMRPMITRMLDSQVTRRELPPLPPVVTTPTLTDRAPVRLTLPPVFVPFMEESGLPTRVTWLLPVAPLLAVGITLVMARRRRFDRRTTGVWVGLSILLGLHAPLTLLALRQRPTLVPCPACGRRRVVDRETCEHCAAPWPTPGDPATAVIEPVTVAA